MLDDARAVLPPPGWYADPEDGSRRWWNGIAWAERGKGPTGDRSRAAWGVSTDTWPVRLLVLVPLVVLVPMMVLDLGGWFRAASAAPDAPTGALLPVLLALQVAGLVLWAVRVALAAADRHILRARGIVAPFHWAWMILSPTVYFIGRAVVLRRRTGRGAAPLVAYLLVSVVGGMALGLRMLAVLTPLMLEIAATQR
ncbi:DUF2510 domain-containing protein [Amnibacterium sp. CER49]|uniref:DUF2510 domain-containing protein n=1 Tax=Amnibacterium sp. CER49 TaxID=3039161 RepID=UPI00244A7420|nr:DUF2510 domain-containing protein [Amnibacterium sp. CER49]MDH2444380.1 DUF2510 domain-containing protein [Amnibacterium sp. CER49]